MGKDSGVNSLLASPLDHPKATAGAGVAIEYEVIPHIDMFTSQY